MTSTLRLSGDFDYAGLDSLCQSLHHLQDWQPGISAQVDLRELGVLSTSTLALLLASLRGLHSRRICDPLADFLPPLDGRAPRCLSNGALEDLISAGKGHWQKEKGAALLLGCEPFANRPAIDRAAAALRTTLETHTGWSDASLGSFGSLAAEFAGNVMQHSDAHGGVIVMELQPTDQRVTLAIADSGIGVRESLARNPRYRYVGDDLTAIRTALRAGATSEPGTGGGMGLYLARLVVRDNQGTFLIRSGDACHEENEKSNDSMYLPELHGTLITVQARTDRAFDYGRIDEWLKEPGGLAG